MAKKVFEGIMAGLEDAIAYNEGDKSRGSAHVIDTDTIDVAAARKKLGMTQVGFALAFGISVSTVRNWEQKRRQPEGPARAFLKVIDKEPEAVKRALA